MLQTEDMSEKDEDMDKPKKRGRPPKAPEPEPVAAEVAPEPVKEKPNLTKQIIATMRGAATAEKMVK